MTAIKHSKDCGNSPKNKLVQEFAIALETGRVHDAFTDGVIWRRTSKSTLEGKQALLAALARAVPPEKLTIEHAIAHGKVGVASGASQSAGKTRRFCHVFELASASGDRVAAIASYLA